jgi:hypothetical protein
MVRPLRIDLEEGWHHVINRGIAAALFAVAGANALGQSQKQSNRDFTRYAMQLREKALHKAAPNLIMSPAKIGFSGPGQRFGTTSALAGPGAASSVPGQYPWKLNVTTTVFWIGEQADFDNPVPNDKSAWDGEWCSSYGGYDNPDSGARRNFIPIDFLPRQNPFYVALPYNDVDDHHTKPEAAQVIPWFKKAFVRDGQSVCKGRWVAIRHGNRVCYAQWEDAGPFRTDDWPYVFGSECPKPNRNQDAGLDVSPAVRDYLRVGGMDACDWKFVDFCYVPEGPWVRYSDNATFVRLRRQSSTSSASQPVPPRSVKSVSRERF